jgi:hypothetical protein
MPDIQNNFVQSKMNQDLDDRLIPPGEYRSAQNVAISRSQGEDVGALENIEGNNLIQNSDLASIPHLDVVGYFVDLSQNNIYLFLTDYIDTSNNGIDNFAPSGANCFIYRFNNEGNGTFTKLVEGSFLNFSKNSPIYGVSMIENLLFFTDYRNQPRKINVTTAAGNNTYYQNEDQISVAKFAPVNPVRFVDMAYNNKLKSTISNPSQEFLPVNLSSEVTSNGSVTTVQFTAINGTTFIPQVGSKIVSRSNADLNGKIVLASPAPTSTQVSFTNAVTVSNSDDISFQQPNPDYSETWAGDPDYVKDRFIRFSYRFKFDDGEYSIMAPFSQSCFVPKQSGYFILNDDDQTYRSTVVSFMENNATQVDLNIEMPYADIETNLKVTEVEILYKESDQVAIKSVESIPISIVNNNMGSNTNNNIFTYKYLSTKPYKVLPEDQTTRVYDKVPVRAFSQETSSNRIIYGNYIDKHSSPDSLTYGLGFANKTEVNTGSPDSNTIYSQIEYPNHTLKQNRNYQLGVVLADRYGRSSTTILSSKDVSDTESLIQYGNSTIYVPYISWGAPSSSTSSNAMYKWPGYSLSVLFENKKGSTSAIPTIPSNGYPGTYVPIGAVGAIAINAGGTGYSDATNVATTGGGGTGLTVDITTTAGEITSISIAKMGEGYTNETTGAITITGGGGNATATITLAEPNLLGWYSYKFVVRQTEQDYYNVYVPGILDGYPNHGGTSPYPTNEDGETSHIVLINDNINKVPRDLSEVGPEQKQFRSSVRLFGRVENTQPVSSVTSSVQYNTNTTASTTSQTIRESSKAFIVSTIGTAEDLNMNYAELSATGKLNFYQLDTNPLIGRISTDKAIGALSTGSNVTTMLPQLAVLETEAVESALDIYWETTTAGLVEDLNLEVKQASSSTAPVALSSTVAAQNENFPINADVFGSLSTPINAIDSSGQTVIGQSFDIISSTRGNGNTLSAKDVNNSSVDPFIIFNSGNGFYIQTNGFFNVSINAVENNFNITIRVTDNTNLTFVDFVVSWTLGNTIPDFGTTPGPYIIQGAGPIANSDYSANAVNGVNSSASLTQRQQDLSFSIAANTVTKGGVTDPALNNYGFSIASNGTSLSQSNSTLTTADNGDYIIPIIVTDAGSLTATTNATVTVSVGVQASIDLQINNISNTYSGNIDMQAEFIYSVSGTQQASQTLQASSTSSNPFGIAVGFLNLQPQPTGSTNETITVNVRRQTGGVPAQVPNPDTLTISVFANGLQQTNPLLQTTIQSPQTITDVGTITLPHLAPSTGTNNILTGTDITTNNTLGFRVVIDLA